MFGAAVKDVAGELNVESSGESDTAKISKKKIALY